MGVFFSLPQEMLMNLHTTISIHTNQKYKSFYCISIHATLENLISKFFSVSGEKKIHESTSLVFHHQYELMHFKPEDKPDIYSNTLIVY